MSDVVVPELGAASEMTLAAWLKQPGERVEAGEVIAEVFTDKVNTEISAPASGVVEHHLADEGNVVTAGQIIAQIADD